MKCVKLSRLITANMGKITFVDDSSLYFKQRGAATQPYVQCDKGQSIQARACMLWPLSHST